MKFFNYNNSHFYYSSTVFTSRYTSYCTIWKRYIKNPNYSERVIYHYSLEDFNSLPPIPRIILWLPKTVHKLLQAYREKYES